MKIYKYCLIKNKNLKNWLKYWLYKNFCYIIKLSNLLKGESFSLTNTIDKKFKIFKLFGNSKQNETPSTSNPILIENSGDGKNLLNIQKIVKGYLDNGELKYADNVDSLVLNDNSFSFTTNANYKGVTTNYILIDKTIVVSFEYTTKINVIACCYDGSKTYIANATRTWINDQTYKFELANGTKYIRMSFYLSTAGSTTVSNPMIEVGSQATQYISYGKGNLSEKIINKNVFDKTNLINAYLDNNGNPVANNSFRVTDFIPVPSSVTNIVIIGNSGSGEIIVFYNQNKEKISTTGTGSYINYSINKPNNAVFMRATLKATVIDSYAIYFNATTSDSYVAHQEQAFIIPCQQPMRSIGDVRDEFVEENGAWYERHLIGTIDSYNGETITTSYMSTTGELSTGAFVQYVLETPLDLVCTQEQITALNSLGNLKTYENDTSISSNDNIPPYLNIQYWYKKEG